MINGFRATVGTEEMIAHLADRAKHHHGRADWYGQEQARFDDVPLQPGTSGDPARSLKEAGKRHADKAAIFEWLAKHVPQGEVFVLSTNELAELEFVSARLGY